MTVREPEAVVASVEGYDLHGPRTVLRQRGPEVVLFVQRGRVRGRPWLRFLRRIDQTGWWVSAYRTRRLAVMGDLA